MEKPNPKAVHDEFAERAFKSNLTQDPTELTRLAVLEAKAAAREIVAALREVLETKIEGRVATTDQRFSGMDTAIKLLQSMRDQGHIDVEAKIAALRTLHEEKFQSIATQFSERDVRTEQTAKDSKVAVDAALQAAKEAVAEQNKSTALSVAKSEGATNKQIDAQAQLITSSSQALDGKITDVKDRLTRLEGERKGSAATWGVIGAVAGIVIASAAALFTRSPVQPTTAYVPAPVVQVAPNTAK